MMQVKGKNPSADKVILKHSHNEYWVDAFLKREKLLLFTFAEQMCE